MSFTKVDPLRNVTVGLCWFHFWYSYLTLLRSFGLNKTWS